MSIDNFVDCPFHRCDTSSEQLIKTLQARLFVKTFTSDQRFLRNCRSTEKKNLGHVLRYGAEFFDESGRVNQCGTKGKVYGCELNLNH